MDESPAAIPHGERLLREGALKGHRLELTDLGYEFGVLGRCDCGLTARDVVNGVGPTGPALHSYCILAHIWRQR